MNTSPTVEDLEFVNDFGGEEHKRHLLRLERTAKIDEQIKYLNKGEFDLLEIQDLFGLRPKSIIIKRNTLRVQQFMQEKILYRQDGIRAPSWSELMFDLVFVSVFRQLGRIIESNPSIEQLQQYILLFALLWISWGNATFAINMFVKTDVFERFFLIFMGAIVLGMGMNSSSEDGSLFLKYFLVGRALTVFCKLPFLVHEPDYRVYFIINILFSIIPCIFLILAIALVDYYQNMIVTFVFFELLMYSVFNVFIKFVVRMKKVPAISVIHAKNRIGLLTIVVLGEITFSLLIDSTSINAFYIGMCGLVVASRIQYIYFKTESEGKGIELVRGENRLYAPIWFFLHLPLHCFIALSGASLAIIVHDTARIDEPDRAFFKKDPKTQDTLEHDFEFAKTLYFACLSLIMINLAVMSVIQKKICKSKDMDWKPIIGCVVLFIVFGSLAITSVYISMSVAIVSGISALLMTLLSAMEEWREAKGLWKSK